VMKITILLGVMLSILGVGFYTGTDTDSPTALIPVAFGVLLVIAGLLSLSEKRRMHAMHVAVLVALLGAAGGIVMGIMGIGKGKSQVAIVEQLIMGVLCALYVVLSARSFLAAGKRRRGEEAQM